MMDKSTIAAIATPAGRGGIGIIKISGPEALSIASSMFRRAWNKKDKAENTPYSTMALPAFESHRLYHGYIIDSDKDVVVDEILLAVMKAPRSYTMENIVEIQAHSGHLVLSSILDLVLKKGARLAAPGEFTKRAYINGRIDLTQAEAVIDIINARSAGSLNVAMAQMRGGLKKRIDLVRAALLDILTKFEAVIDFPDDVEDILDNQILTDSIEKDIVHPLQELIDKHNQVGFLREGLRLVIAGRPNVGKSSLMNLLVKKERSIVTAIPGTTRDLIEDSLVLNGVPIVVSDTAGLHETRDPIEAIGIERARKQIDTSDILLFMVDATAGLMAEDFKFIEKVKYKKVILIINKTDIVDENFDPEIPAIWKKVPVVKISALLNQGINELRDRIVDMASKEIFIDRNTIVPNLRQKIALENSLENVNDALEGLENGLPYELLSINIKESFEELGEIIGATAKPDILDNIFSTFCIGK